MPSFVALERMPKAAADLTAVRRLMDRVDSWADSIS